MSDIVIKAIMSPTPVIRPSNSPGLQGPRGWEVQLEYSVDGESWHTTPTSNDYYVRFSTDEGTTWGTAWYIRGEQGEQGATGETGATGATITSVAIVGTDIVFTKSDASTVTLTGAVTTLKGDAGANGTDGNTILSGAVDPTTEGEDGDFYLNTTSWDVFKKISGEWSLQGNIKGASGEGSGDVVGPEGATAGNLATFSGTSGKIIQDSGSKVADFEPAIGAKGTAFNKDFGSSADTVCQGNDSRLSNARTPTTHGNDKHSATYITSSDVTYENLSANGDVGTGSSQVAQGDHNHDSDYASASHYHDDVVLKSVGTTKGDIIAFTASATPARVGVGTDTYLLVADSSATPGVKWTNRITSLIEEVVKKSTGNLSTAEVSGTIINNYGQSNNVVLTLPTAAEGMSFMVVLGTTVAKYFRIKANTNDKIYLDGTAGTDNYYVGIASAAIGAMISFATFQTGASSYDWVATTISGTWEAQK